jgi:transposase
MESALVLTAKIGSISPEYVASLEEKIAQFERENRLLQEKIHYLLHHRFGRHSERFNPDQGVLFEPQVPTDAKADVEDTIQIEAHTRKKGGRRKAPRDLPRERVEHHLPQAEKQCTCGACLERIGEEISEQYDVVPPVFRVLEHVRFKYACPVCDDNGVKTAAKSLPDPLPRHQVSPGLLAWIGTGKYVDGLPLHRQASILEKRFGVPFTSTTLSHWMIKVANDLLIPLLVVMEMYLLGEDYLHADETTVQVLGEPARDPWQKSYFWIRVSGAGPPIVIVTYDSSRGGSVANGLFSGFKGYLQTDAYSGYSGVWAQAEVTPVGCWAHARRKFDAVLRSVGRHSQRHEAVLAREALEFIRRLYQIERESKGEAPAERLRRRQTDSQGVLEEMAAWREKHMAYATAIGGSLAKAFVYLTNQWEKLIVFVQDERLALDNNLAERHIRPIANGRKAWLFAKSEDGAHASAAWYSIVETAKANGLEPYHYLRWLFTNLPLYIQSGWPLDPLMPWNVTTEQINAPSSRRG